MRHSSVRFYSEQILLVLGFVLSFVCISASAASFDCRKATTEIEKSICADPGLSALDSKLAQVYRDQLEKLPSEGKVLLRDYQVDWIVWLRATCRSDSLGSTPIEQCLTEQYNARIQLLNHTLVVSDGPMRVMLGTVYSTKQSASGPLNPMGPFVVPIILLPKTDLARRWNGTAIRFAVPSNYLSDASAVSTIHWSGAGGVSAIVTASWDAPTGRRVAAAQGFTWLAGRGPLQDRHIFNTKLQWRQTLQNACLQAIALAAQELADKNQGQISDSDLIYVAKATCEKQEPSKWAISKAGLIIIANQRAWALGLDDPVIPWSELKDVLAVDWKIQ